MIINHKMKFMLIVCAIIALSFNVCESKGGSRGSSSRGSSSRGSSGGGYFGGGSKSSSSGSSSGGYFGGGSKSSSSGSSSGGWFGGGSKSSGKTSGNNRQPSHQTNYHTQNHYNSYSSPSFGGGYRSGYGGGNTYVNNYYGGRRSSYGSSFLTYGLLYGAGMHHGHSMGRSSSRRWDDDDDRRWRASTRAPYFENKQPGSESILPAAAVLGAATAFGVYSLLPLNVPNGQPILSCNATDLQQTQINFDGSTYGCSNRIVTVACFKVDPITNKTIDLCPGNSLECDKTSDFSIISCTNGTLLSSEPIFCNSTTILDGTNVNDPTKILNCYAGVLARNIAGSIPTQEPEIVPEKPLSIAAHVHTFLLWTMGKSDILERKTTTTEKPEESPFDYVPRFLSENDTIAFVPPAVVDTITNTTTATSLIDTLQQDSDNLLKISEEETE